MSSLLLSLLFFALTFTPLVQDAIVDIPDPEIRAQLEEIYARNEAMSPDMVLPADYVNSKFALQELYAQNWGVSPEMILPPGFVTTKAILEELFAQNWTLSENMDISK